MKGSFRPKSAPDRFETSKGQNYHRLLCIIPLLGLPQILEAPSAFAQTSGDSRCFKMHWTAEKDTFLNKFCEFAKMHIRRDGDTSFYLKAKPVFECESVESLSKMEHSPLLFARVKPAAQWDLNDLADIVRIEMECRTHLGLRHFYDFDGPEDLDSMVILNVMDTFGDAVNSAKQREAQEAESQAYKARQDRAAAEVWERHLKQLADLGYRRVRVSDIQINGDKMIGQKVAVTAYVRVFSDGAARLYTHSDDLNGVDLDISAGNQVIRRHLLENCTSLTMNCPPVEVLATVVEGDPYPALRLD